MVVKASHAQRARIQNRDVLAEALETSLKTLKTHVDRQERDLDQEIQYSKIPDHLQLLVRRFLFLASFVRSNERGFQILLSRPPNKSSIAFADEYMFKVHNPATVEKRTTWQDIFMDEPFQGQHWQGVYGLPPGSVKKDWDDEEQVSSGSEASSASSISFDLGIRDGEQDDNESVSSRGLSERGAVALAAQHENPLVRAARDRLAHRKAVEELQARQYWRPEWKSDIPPNRHFDFSDASTLGGCARDPFLPRNWRSKYPFF
jgi:gamma-tubulin complex component 5